MPEGIGASWCGSWLENSSRCWKASFGQEVTKQHFWRRKKRHKQIKRKQNGKWTSSNQADSHCLESWITEGKTELVLDSKAHLTFKILDTLWKLRVAIYFMSPEHFIGVCRKVLRLTYADKNGLWKERPRGIKKVAKIFCLETLVCCPDGLWWTALGGGEVLKEKY